MRERRYAIEINHEVETGLSVGLAGGSFDVWLCEDKPN